MGRSQAEKAASHARILDAAARRLRADGLDGVSVADLMREAGLTHGAFYRHFPSRDGLVAEAVAHALAGGADRLRRVPGGVNGLVDAYLQPAHRDDVAEGCAMAALAPEVARTTGPCRTAFTDAVERTAGLLQEVAGDHAGSGGDDGDPAGTRADAQADARARALARLAGLVGALVLARAVDDPTLSDEILAAGRTHLRENG